MEITSVENARVKYWNNLKIKKYRDKEGLFIVEEKHMIEEAISAGLLDTLLVRSGVDNQFSVEPVYVADHVMKKLSEHVSLDDYLAIVRMPLVQIKQGSRFIIMEKVQDPGNVGTIIRTAHSFGYDGVLLSKECADIYNEKTIQASQGAIFHMPVVRQEFDEILTTMRKLGVEIIAADLHNSHYLSDCKVSDKYAIMVGNEGKGLSEKAIAASDQRVKIEMAHFESLNVAIAAGILAYHFRYHN